MTSNRIAASATVFFLALLGLSLASCASLLPPRARPGVSLATAVETLPWPAGEVRGQQLLTAHYRIMTTTENRRVLSILPGLLERAHEHYLSLTGLSEQAGDKALKPALVYLLADRAQWAALTEQLTGAEAPTYLAIDTGGYCYRDICVLWDLRHYATFSVAAHEGMHQFLHRRLKDPLPAWLEEGLCALAEGSELGETTVRFDPECNLPRRGALRSALANGRWISLDKLIATDAGDYLQDSRTAPEYYAQLWALLLYVRSDAGLNQGLQRLIHDAADGKLVSGLGRLPIPAGTKEHNEAISLPLFQKYLARDVKAFEQSYRRFATKLADLEDKPARNPWLIW